MLAGGEGGLDVLWLADDGESNDDGLDVLAEEQVVVRLANTRVGRVEIQAGPRLDEGCGLLSGFQGSRVDGLELKQVTLGNGRLVLLEDRAVTGKAGD